MKMVKAEKLILKIKSKPTPTNIKWSELVLVLKHRGYTMVEGNGSRRKFHNLVMNHVISLHQPHPGNEVRPCYIEEVRTVLEELGLI